MKYVAPAELPWDQSCIYGCTPATPLAPTSVSVSMENAYIGQVSVRNDRVYDESTDIIHI